MLTNSELNQKITDFQKKVQSEGYKDITFERYNMYSGNWGIRCMHKDYSDACYNTGTFGTMEQKYEKLVGMFDHYVRNNPKYM